MLALNLIKYHDSQPFKIICYFNKKFRFYIISPFICILLPDLSKQEVQIRIFPLLLRFIYKFNDFWISP